jgi:hypothetical protein
MLRRYQILNVSSQPKILQNNKKTGRIKKIISRENLAAVRPPIWTKAAEKMLLEKYEFSHDLLAFVSNCNQIFSETIFQGITFLC